jgi:uncharacterized membrane protein
MNNEHIQAALTWALTFTGLLLVAALIGLSGALIKLVLHLLGIDNSL